MDKLLNIKKAVLEFISKYPLIVLLIAVLCIDSYFAHKRLFTYRDGIKETLPEACQEAFIEYDNTFFNASDSYENNEI